MVIVLLLSSVSLDPQVCYGFQFVYASEFGWRYMNIFIHDKWNDFKYRRNGLLSYLTHYANMPLLIWWSLNYWNRSIKSNIVSQHLFVQYSPFLIPCLHFFLTIPISPSHRQVHRLAVHWGWYNCSKSGIFMHLFVDR